MVQYTVLLPSTLILLALAPFAMCAGALLGVYLARTRVKPRYGEGARRALVASGGVGLAAMLLSVALVFFLPTLLGARLPNLAKVARESVSFGVSIGLYCIPWLLGASWLGGE